MKMLEAYRIFYLPLKNNYRFSDESMETEYQKQLSDIDTKLFLVFSIFLCIITTLDFVLSLTKPSEGRNLVPLIFQVALPITALILQKYAPVLSRVVFVAAALLFLYMLFHDFIYFYSDGVPSQYFYIGNVIGLCEVVIMTNIQSLFYKLVLGVAILLQKLLIMKDGFLYTTANLVGILIVSTLVVMSFFYQEVMNRGRFKLGYESQERLKKFQSLLSDDLPISVLIVTADFLSVQFSNTLFDLNFKERNDQQISLDSLFEKFELDIDPKILGLTNNNRLTLIDFVKSLQLNFNNLKDRNLMVLPAIYRNSRVPLLCKPAQHYEIKVRKIKWDTISSYAFIFNDVSEKHLVTALKLADEQKNRLIATVSHELRTPINGTLGLLGLLESRINDEISKSYIQHCINCNKLLLYLVNSILDLSKLRDNTLRISKETFSLDSILDEIKCLYQYQCQQKGIAFSVIRNQHVPKEIFTDKYKLMEVLIHLVGNAVKFTFHGSVLLEVGISDEDKDVLEFTVRDTGIGIKEEDKPGLLQMFEDVSINNHNINTSGAGLGLAVVTGLLAALNNGFQENLWFESQYGRGTVFSFRIMNYHSERLISLATPNDSSESEMVFNCEFLKECKVREEVPIERILSHESISQINNLNQLPKPVKQGKTDEYQLLHTEEESVHLNNVLVVDDNPLNILAASFLLEKIKCKVEKAFNGQECIEELERSFRQNKFYDLILMDIQMPVMDGPQASKLICEKINKGELPHVPIIALTAKKSTEEEKLYYSECGIKAVLEKPLNTDKLLEAIGKFVK